MSKPINEPRMVQQALVSDEDLSFELAALVPTANGITNAASTFIDKATKLLLSDKIILTNEQHTAVTSAIAIAQLTVKEGAMTARMTMGGTGYLYVYMGTGEEASKVPESDLISFEENSDGTHSFTVPVETLNEVLPCTAFSKKKEKWYDRELVFEASGIPADAFLNTSLKTVEDLGLADGTYTVEAALTGGSGRASVESPAVVEVKAERQKRRSSGAAPTTTICGWTRRSFFRSIRREIPPL